MEIWLRSSGVYDPQKVNNCSQQYVINGCRRVTGIRILPRDHGPVLAVDDWSK